MISLSPFQAGIELARLVKKAKPYTARHIRKLIVQGKLEADRHGVRDWAITESALIKLANSGLLRPGKK